MNVKTVLACLVLLFVPQLLCAAQKGWRILDLPPNIETKQEINMIPEGWLASTGKDLNRPAGIMVFDGRPEHNASLIPDDEEQHAAKEQIISSWKLTPSSSDGTWISVSYSGTSVALAKQLPLGTTNLCVVYDMSITVEGLNQIVRIEYK